MSPLRILTAAMVVSMAAPGAEIPAGRHMLLRIMNSINTRTAQEGDVVYMQTASPLAVDNRIVVPPGSYVQGVVTRSKRGGRVSGTAELGIRLETLTLHDGRSFKFAPRLSSVESGNTGQKVERQEDLVRQSPEKEKDVARVAIFAGGGASIGGIADSSWKGAGIGAGIGSAVGVATALATRGSDVQLRAGSSLDVVFDRAITLE
jgi:hypothetical protein